MAGGRQQLQNSPKRGNRLALNRRAGRPLLEHLQQVLVFMPLLQRGEKAEAHPTAHGNRLEPHELFLRDRMLDRIEVQERPRLEE